MFENLIFYKIVEFFFRSAHGFSDTDMATLLDQLQRESEDLCGHRGLLAGTDEQTFSMALPAKLRNYYDKVVTPATSMGGGASAGPRSHKLTGTAVQQMVQAYGTMNKFLTRFLEHVSLVVNVTFFTKFFCQYLILILGSQGFGL